MEHGRDVIIGVLKQSPKTGGAKNWKKTQRLLHY